MTSLEKIKKFDKCSMQKVENISYADGTSEWQEKERKLLQDMWEQEKQTEIMLRINYERFHRRFDI